MITAPKNCYHVYVKREIIQKPKAEYRYKYFKDFQNTIITVCGGTVVASLAFVSNLDVRHHPLLAYCGLAALGLAILIHIVLLFLNYIGSGFLHDFLIAEDEGDLTSYSASKEGLEWVGKLINPLVLTSLVLTPVGFALLFLFVVKNI